jgi:hypothetical protein
MIRGKEELVLLKKYPPMLNKKNTWSQVPFDINRSYEIKLGKKYGFKCYVFNGHGCGKRIPIRLLSIDHILPISQGGSVRDINNMQILCFECHRKKTGDDSRRFGRQITEFRKKGTQKISNREEFYEDLNNLPIEIMGFFDPSYLRNGIRIDSRHR